MSEAPIRPVKLGYGHINIANERGWHPGCMAVTFHRKSLALEMNDFFAKIQAALVTAILPVGKDEVLVLFTKRLADEDKAEYDEFNSMYARYKEKKKLRRMKQEEESRKAVQEQIAAKAKERELFKKRLGKLAEAGMRHLKNCKKDAAELELAKKDLADLAKLDEPEGNVVVDTLPAKTELKHAAP